MLNEKTYRIYSHSDADGGIAAAIFASYFQKKYEGWKIEINPVSHVSSQGEWYTREISWPCAILDFTLHPSLLNERFFQKQSSFSGKDKAPECYWIDHHPTGSPFSFLSTTNVRDFLPNMTTKWDTTAISTPGLLRTHHQELQIPVSLIKEYEEFIDLAEIIDGALYATCDAAHDYSSSAVKLQTLFSTSHPAIDKTALYKRLTKQIWQNSSVEALFDSDLIYPSLIAYEEQEYLKQLEAYNKVTKLRGKVAVANFEDKNKYLGFGRFLPYQIFPQAQYALHVMPRGKGDLFSLSCGINPWNPEINKEKMEEKNLGAYFAKHFGGGGHSFVAGGKTTREELKKIDLLLDFLNTL